MFGWHRDDKTLSLDVLRRIEELERLLARERRSRKEAEGKATRAAGPEPGSFRGDVTALLHVAHDRRHLLPADARKACERVAGHMGPDGRWK